LGPRRKTLPSSPENWSSGCAHRRAPLSFTQAVNIAVGARSGTGSAGSIRAAVVDIGPGGQHHGWARSGRSPESIVSEAWEEHMDRAALRSRLVGRTEGFASELRRQWRPVVAPALVLWVIAAFVGGIYLKSFDVLEYERYAHMALHSPLLRHLPHEYPAPALAVFLLPLLLPFAYPWAFAVFVGVVLVLLTTSYGTSGVPGIDTEGAGRLIAYLSLGEVMALTTRFDIFAVAAAFWALRAARQGRWSAAWTWSSVGFLLKLFPAVLWPAFLIAEWRHTGRVPLRRLYWMVGSVLAIVALPVLFDRSALSTVLDYYVQRPPEIGSVAGGLSLLDWHHWHAVYTFNSMNTLNPLARNLAPVIQLAGVIGIGWVFWLQSRDRLTLEATCLASLTLLVLTAKVGSVQYFMWLMPFWALYRFRITWLLACVANTIVFPFTTWAQQFAHFTSHSYYVALTLTYLARDLLVVAGTWGWFRAALGPREGPPLPRAGPGPTTQ
jgi:hypothetical protein